MNYLKEKKAHFKDKKYIQKNRLSKKYSKNKEKNTYNNKENLLLVLQAY